MVIVGFVVFSFVPEHLTFVKPLILVPLAT